MINQRVFQRSVNLEVIIELPGGVEITSIITKSSADNLGLRRARGIRRN